MKQQERQLAYTAYLKVAIIDLKNASSYMEAMLLDMDSSESKVKQSAKNLIKKVIRNNNDSLNAIRLNLGHKSFDEFSKSFMNDDDIAQFNNISMYFNDMDKARKNEIEEFIIQKFNEFKQEKTNK